MRIVGISVLVLGMATALSGCATSGATSSLGDAGARSAFAANLPASLPGNGAVMPTPPGFVAFCLRMPDQCAVDENAPKVVAWNDQLMATLEKTNASVNDAIWPQEDERHYGRAEYWTIPTDGYGDCEDYALAKRKTLIASGISAAALEVAIVQTRREVRHAVLTVNTDRGTLVLDNLRNDVLPWTTTGFSWISRQAAGNPLVWTSLRNPTILAQLDNNTPTAANQ